jgi:hypothetical protein
MSQAGDWPTKHPWRLLPREGRHPYVPPKGGDWLKHAPRGPQRGYLDADDNEWVSHQPPGGREEDFHWDVQHLDGRHTNVRPDGEIHHGSDNFPR